MIRIHMNLYDLLFRCALIFAKAEVVRALEAAMWPRAARGAFIYEAAAPLPRRELGRGGLREDGQFSYGSVFVLSLWKNRLRTDQGHYHYEKKGLKK